MPANVEILISSNAQQAIQEAKKMQAEMDALKKALKDAGVSQEAYNKTLAAQQKAQAEANKTSQQTKMSMTDIYSATQLAAQGLQKLKQAYDFAKQGAQIEFLQGKFERLAASIGTTGDA